MQKRKTIKLRKTKLRKTKLRKAKGKTIKGNRQLSTFLKNQGTLSYNLDGADYELKINDDIIEKIDKILKDELDKQKNNKEKILNKLRSFEKIIKILFRSFNDEKLIAILREMKEIRELPIENFDSNRLEIMKDKVTEIKNDIVNFINARENIDDGAELIQELEKINDYSL